MRSICFYSQFEDPLCCWLLEIVASPILLYFVLLHICLHLHHVLSMKETHFLSLRAGHLLGHFHILHKDLFLLFALYIFSPRAIDSERCPLHHNTTTTLQSVYLPLGALYAQATGTFCCFPFQCLLGSSFSCCSKRAFLTAASAFLSAPAALLPLILSKRPNVRLSVSNYLNWKLSQRSSILHVLCPSNAVRSKSATCVYLAS